MIRSIIIEDTLLEQKRLEKMIEKVNAQLPLQHNIEIVSTLLTHKSSRKRISMVETAIEIIQQYAPELIFLDIELEHDFDGFSILENFTQRDFQVIIITAHLQLGFVAIDYEITDVWHKDSSSEQLFFALGKVIRKRDAAVSDIQIFDNTSRGAYPLQMQRILYCEADGNYTIVHLTDNLFFRFQKMSTSLSSQTLRRFEEFLPKEHFIRIHDSYIININFVKSYTSKSVILQNDTELTISRTYKKNAINMMLTNGKLNHKANFFFTLFK